MRIRWSALAFLLALPFAQGAVAADAASTPAFLFIPLATNDFSFSQAAYEGYERLTKQGYKIAYQANTDSLSDAEKMALVDKNYADGVRAFIVVGAELSEFTTTAAKKYPEARFATLAGTSNGDNVLDFCLDCLQVGGVLAGKVALELSSSKVMGFVGGVSSVDGGEARKFRATIPGRGPEGEGADQLDQQLVRPRRRRPAHRRADRRRRRRRLCDGQHGRHHGRREASGRQGPRRPGRCLVAVEERGGERHHPHGHRVPEVPRGRGRRHLPAGRLRGERHGRDMGSSAHAVSRGETSARGHGPHVTPAKAGAHCPDG
ncbi:MAG: BMP family ABC transporter substrate-binding protein [Hyphomicrobium sp.]